jgi:uncharacterized membrane protein
MPRDAEEAAPSRSRLDSLSGARRGPACGLFGVFAYGTYDLTNQTTLRNWPTHLTVIDLACGSVLAALAATIGYLAASRF